MAITGAQCRAARALVQWPRDHVARLADLAVEILEAIERGQAHPSEEVADRLQRVLEEGGAVFIPEGDGQGVGVRLKFSGKAVRAINKWEGEGGTVGADDV